MTDLPPLNRSTELLLERIAEQAAEKAAKKALERIGLHDEQAGGDVRDLRTLLKAWRDANQTFRQTVVRVLTTAALGLLAGGAMVWLWKNDR